jgi:hypothetical protein
MQALESVTAALLNEPSEAFRAAAGRVLAEVRKNHQGEWDETPALRVAVPRSNGVVDRDWCVLGKSADDRYVVGRFTGREFEPYKVLPLNILQAFNPSFVNSADWQPACVTPSEESRQDMLGLCFGAGRHASIKNLLPEELLGSQGQEAFARLTVERIFKELFTKFPGEKSPFGEPSSTIWTLRQLENGRDAYTSFVRSRSGTEDSDPLVIKEGAEAVFRLAMQMFNRSFDAERNLRLTAQRDGLHRDYCEIFAKALSTMMTSSRLSPETFHEGYDNALRAAGAELSRKYPGKFEGDWWKSNPALYRELAAAMDRAMFPERR